MLQSALPTKTARIAHHGEHLLHDAVFLGFAFLLRGGKPATILLLPTWGANHMHGKKAVKVQDTTQRGGSSTESAPATDLWHLRRPPRRTLLLLSLTLQLLVCVTRRLLLLSGPAEFVTQLVRSERTAAVATCAPVDRPASPITQHD